MNTENTNITEGLFLTGTVIQRCRKYIGEDRKKVVTYLISAGNVYFFLDEYQPQNYYGVGEHISVPVNCRAFTRKNDRLGVSFTIRGNHGIILSGEDF